LSQFDGYRLQRFTTDGVLLGKEERFGDAGEPFNPFAVAVDSASNVYVADINGGTGDRILIFGDRR
jgi:hypothetical protein